MEEGKAVFVQYVFLDVVKFTQGRTVEAQVDVVRALNRIVQGALGESDLNSKDLILLPTGDGICLALLRADPFDLSLKLSLSILKSLAEHNNSTDDRKRQFEIRVGVNQNIDNLVIDINGNQNVAGRGIRAGYLCLYGGFA